MRAALLIVLAACGAPVAPVQAPAPNPVVQEAPKPPDPDLNPAPPRRVLAIDWDKVSVATDAEANALWAQIAPTGDDWELKLGEVPDHVTKPLAIALLRGGNFTCMTPPPAAECVKPQFSVDEPAPAAGLADPCLRRLLALWSIAQLDETDVPRVIDALRGIVAIPPPESQLVAAAIELLPEADQATNLELLGLAWKAGQHDVVQASIDVLEEPAVIEAVRKHHIDSGLELLAAESHRAVYLAAMLDEQLGSRARIEAMLELAAVDDKLPADLRDTLAKAAKSPDCAVAARAARVLELRGDRRFVPVRPRTRSAQTMLRSLCVLAHYEQLQRSDESSLLAGYVPAKGLERVQVAYDGLGDTDTDGDGDPHTTTTIDLVPRAELVIPEVDDVARALRNCTGALCRDGDREFRFGFKPAGGQLYLSRLEIIERPPCPR